MAELERGSLFAELKRDQMHSRDIVAALEFLRDSLDREDIPFGLIGGLALRHHGYTRFTEDIDIVTSPEGLDRIHVSLIGRGLRGCFKTYPSGPRASEKFRGQGARRRRSNGVDRRRRATQIHGLRSRPNPGDVLKQPLGPRAEGLRKRLRQTEFKVDIDVVTSGEHAGSDESPTIYPDPESDAFVDREGIRVVTLQKLVEFKVASGVWGHRVQDLGDVQRLIQANGLTESFAEKLPEPLRAKFLELLAESRLERDLE